MRFYWEDGYTLDLPFGDLVRGLTHNSKRPYKIGILQEELIHLDPRDNHKHKIYLYMLPYVLDYGNRTNIMISQSLDYD